MANIQALREQALQTPGCYYDRYFAKPVKTWKLPDGTFLKEYEYYSKLSRFAITGKTIAECGATASKQIFDYSIPAGATLWVEHPDLPDDNTTSPYERLKAAGLKESTCLFLN